MTSSLNRDPNVVLEERDLCESEEPESETIRDLRAQLKAAVEQNKILTSQVERMTKQNEFLKIMSSQVDRLTNQNEMLKATMRSGGLGLYVDPIERA